MGAEPLSTSSRRRELLPGQSAQRLALQGLLIAALAPGKLACSDGDQAAEQVRCAATVTRAEIVFVGVSRMDLLFVIGDSPSMADEQAALQQALPRLVSTLITGELDGVPRFQGIADLQVAVVSATLAGGGGLQPTRTGSQAGCAAEYPEFLRYRGPYFGPDRDDPTAFTRDFGCLLQLGAQAPGPNRPLEAALAALSGAQDAGGFVRSNPRDGLSLIWIVVITDTDDCSIAAATGASDAPTTSASCAAQAQTLESIEHYVESLRGLRTGAEQLVNFTAITGVPPELVDEAARAPVDFDTQRESDAYYQQLLDRPAMQPMPDPDMPARLLPACASERGSAEPARRLVETVRRFGRGGALASICADDYPALFDLLDYSTSREIGVPCLLRPVVRDGEGRIPCKMYWSLPPPELAPEGTPTRCGDRSFLVPAGSDPTRPGAARCELPQLAITSVADLMASDPQDGGWYYDDFSEDVRQCTQPGTGLIAFSEFAGPQSGIFVSLECVALQEPAGASAPTFCAPPDPPPRYPWTTNDVGRTCMPEQIPDGILLDYEVHLETGHPRCGSGPCMVYQLRGDPRPECETCYDLLESRCLLPCPSDDEIRDRVYCTCRCDAPDPSVETCTCPSGFSCVDALELGGPELAGSYCVKDGTL